MEKLDLIFKNGKIVTESGVENCDLGIRDGKISSIGDLSDNAEVI